jgi:lysyl-tRNA synthetase class 2
VNIKAAPKIDLSNRSKEVPSIDTWRPRANPQMLHIRAQLYALIRRFFAEHSVLEVDPPSLATTSVTDPNIESIVAEVGEISGYLQTSPEFFMKRMLASGIGDIYALGKAFRDAEQGSRHNPEFTLLEWYRLDWDEFQLITEVEKLISEVFHTLAGSKIRFQRLSYSDCFERELQFDPHTVSLATLQSNVVDLGYKNWANETRANCLDLLFCEIVEPNLPEGLVSIFDYPACQAALAQTYKDKQGRLVSRRFEVFLGGIELANGYFELTDAQQQRQRFEDDIKQRQQTNKPEINLDAQLDQAMRAGLPSCSGVALGVDRLLMQLCKVSTIDEVLAFPWSRC